MSKPLTLYSRLMKQFNPERDLMWMKASPHTDLLLKTLAKLLETTVLELFAVMLFATCCHQFQNHKIAIV